MFHAVSFAFADSINALLIGVIVAVGIIAPKGKYRNVITLLIAGDWLGVFLLALGVMYIFVGLQDFMRKVLESPVFAIILILVGLVTAVMTWRARPGGNNPLVERILRPLKKASVATVITGFILGVAQSITSVPFFGGILVLATGDFSTLARYGGMIWYATIALSLPILVAIGVGLVRMYPNSWLGRGFEWARANTALVQKAGGYLVAGFLVILGLLQF